MSVQPWLSLIGAPVDRNCINCGYLFAQLLLLTCAHSVASRRSVVTCFSPCAHAWRHAFPSPCWIPFQTTTGPTNYFGLSNKPNRRPRRNCLRYKLARYVDLAHHGPHDTMMVGTARGQMKGGDNNIHILKPETFSQRLLTCDLAPILKSTYFEGGDTTVSDRNFNCDLVASADAKCHHTLSCLIPLFPLNLQGFPKMTFVQALSCRLAAWSLGISQETRCQGLGEWDLFRASSCQRFVNMKVSTLSIPCVWRRQKYVWDFISAWRVNQPVFVGGYCVDALQCFIDNISGCSRPTRRKARET